MGTARPSSCSSTEFCLALSHCASRSLWRLAFGFISAIVLRLASPNKLGVLVAAAYLLLSSRLYSGASASGDEGHAILEQIRKRVTEQISRSANYTCVEQ